MKSLPYERFILYLLLAGNSTKDISSYIKAYKLGKINGRHIRHLVIMIEKETSIDEHSIWKKIQEENNKKKPSSDVITLSLVLPDGLESLANRLGVPDSPFSNLAVKLIIESIMVRRTVEVYLTTKMTLKGIIKIINDKFRLKLSEQDLKDYRYWMYDLASMTPDNMYKYFDTLEKDEQEYKFMAFMEKEDFVKWKMKDKCEIDPEEATRQMMADAFYNFKEIVNMKPVNHSAAKAWSDIYFKCRDYLDSSSETKDGKIFAEFQFKLTKDSKQKPIPFSELLNSDKGKDN